MVRFKTLIYSFTLALTTLNFSYASPAFFEDNPEINHINTNAVKANTYFKSGAAKLLVGTATSLLFTNLTSDHNNVNGRIYDCLTIPQRQLVGWRREDFYRHNCSVTLQEDYDSYNQYSYGAISTGVTSLIFLGSGIWDLGAATYFKTLSFWGTVKIGEETVKNSKDHFHND